MAKKIATETLSREAFEDKFRDAFYPGKDGFKLTVDTTTEHGYDRCGDWVPRQVVNYVTVEYFVEDTEKS